MRIEQGPAFIHRCDVTDTISEKAQRALRGNAGVQLAHSTGGCIAWVDKGFFTLLPGGNACALAIVQSFKVAAGHVNLAAHFQYAGRVRRQMQRNLADGADVVRDIFTGFAITPRGGLHQHTAFITQAHGQAVKLEFSNVVNSGVGLCQTQLFAYTGVKTLCPAGFGVGFGAYAEHGHHVLDAGKTVQNLATNTLRGRIKCEQVRVRKFQGLQLRKQSVVFRIRDLRFIQRVIKMRMML